MHVFTICVSSLLIPLLCTEISCKMLGRLPWLPSPNLVKSLTFQRKMRRAAMPRTVIIHCILNCVAWAEPNSKFSNEAVTVFHDHQ